MRILFDHQAFTIQKYGGISRYYAELINAFKENTEIDTRISLVTSENENLNLIYPGRKLSLLPKQDFRGKTYASHLLNKAGSTLALKRNEFDIFHPTYYDRYFLKSIKKKPFVLTVYDTIYEKLNHLYPELQSDKQGVYDKRKILDAASAIIAISNHTKLDIIELYQLDPSKVVTIPLAMANPETKHFEIDNCFTFDLKKKYLLFVGNRTIYKNFDFFFRSVSSYLYDEKDLYLVCAGGSPFTDAEKQLFKNLGVISRVIHQPINDLSINSIYSGALAFVFPSLYEGFGIPVLEAMGNGSPCILSSGGSLPEVGAESAVYFNPVDSNSILNAVSSVVKDEQLRKSLVKSGRKRVSEFSWKKTADMTFALYDSIL